MQILIVIHMPKVFRAFNIPPCVSLDPRLDEWSNEEQGKKESQATPETKEWIIIVWTTDPVPQRETKDNSVSSRKFIGCNFEARLNHLDDRFVSK